MNPLTGEIIDVADDGALRGHMRLLEDWLGQNDVARIPVWRASKQIQELLTAEPYKVPARTGQTDTQKKLERCPRCSTVLEVAK